MMDALGAGFAVSPTLAMHESVGASSGAVAVDTCYRFGFGQSPFPVPEVVQAALRQHADASVYLPVQGLRELREAIATHYARVHKIHVSPEHIIVGPGSKALLFLIQMAARQPLWLPAPSWVSYAPQARALGLDVHYLKTSFETRYQLEAATLEAAAPDQGGLLLLNYPNNPTGLSADWSSMRALMQVAQAKQMLVVSDEIYGELHHAGRHSSPFTWYPEGTVITGGLSKWCGAGGWRLGYAIVPQALETLRHAMIALASETFSCASAPVQHAATVAFSDQSEVQQQVEGSRAILAPLGKRLAGILRESGVRCHDPEGGFYLFADAEAFRAKLAARGIEDGRALAARLRGEAGVALLPAADFGCELGSLAFRLAYVDFDGASALSAWAGGTAVDTAFLERHCSRVLDGGHALCRWLTQS